MMKISIHKSVEEANAGAAELLAGWLVEGGNVMPAAGGTPLELYGRIGEKGLDLRRLNIFVLDEYVGVPKGEPRNCVNLIRRSVQEGWGIPKEQFYEISSVRAEALASVLAHEGKIEAAGGLDVVVLGLGKNGHLGFNEPGSPEDSGARIVQLEPISVEANRKWFGGRYAPDEGATIGLKTILAAKRILIMAYGSHKAEAVRAMVQGPRGAECPASFLQGHRETYVVLDEMAAAKLR